MADARDACRNPQKDLGCKVKKSAGSRIVTLGHIILPALRPGNRRSFRPASCSPHTLQELIHLEGTPLL